MTQQTAAKLCINCKHYQPGTQTGLDTAEFSRCGALVQETNERLTLVDGRPLVVKYTFCELARGPVRECGPDAKLFEPAQATEAA